MAEWSKAPALGAGPKGRGFEPHCCHVHFFVPVASNITERQFVRTQHVIWACGVVVSRLLCMQKASGSNPDKSIVLEHSCGHCFTWIRITAPHIFRCVVGLVVRISAFQADGPGSIPGQRIFNSSTSVYSSGR